MEAKDHFRMHHIDGKDHLILTPPNIKAVCEPLMGSSLREGGTCSLKELPVQDRVRVYEKALSAIARWQLRDDLLNLALYRRQVTVGTPIDADEHFLWLARTMQPALRPQEWADIAQRMPTGTPIYDACSWYAKRDEEPALAAE